MRLLSRSHPLGLLRPLLSLDWLLVLGVVVLALAASVDLVYYALPFDVELSLQAWLGDHAIRAHLAMFGGMLLMVAGLVRMGVAQ
jgi:hypothetical protein